MLTPVSTPLLELTLKSTCTPGIPFPFWSSTFTPGLGVTIVPTTTDGVVVTVEDADVAVEAMNVNCSAQPMASAPMAPMRSSRARGDRRGVMGLLDLD